MHENRWLLPARTAFARTGYTASTTLVHAFGYSLSNEFADASLLEVKFSKSSGDDTIPCYDPILRRQKRAVVALTLRNL